MSKNFPIFHNHEGPALSYPDELIDLFYKTATGGFVIIGMDDCFIRVSEKYTRIFGYSESEMIGKRFTEFLECDRMAEYVGETKLGKEISNRASQGYHKDGKILDIDVSYSPFRNANKEVIGVIVIFRDITGRKEMERELKKTRGLYQLITENTSDMILVYGRDKRIIYASPSHEVISGQAIDGMIGQHIFDTLNQEERDYFEIIFQRIQDTGEPQIIQSKMKDAEGETIYIESNISPIYNESNRIEFYVSVGRNVTDRIKNDDALRNLDRLSIIGQLAASVAHEIRNPLTSLKGFSKLLQHIDEKDKQTEYLSIISHELERIDGIVNEFMSLAKPQAVDYDQYNLKTILESTINFLHPQAVMNNVQIYLNIPRDTIELLCNSNQLKQVFVNFLKNAIEAMPDGGEVHILVETLENKRVTIQFKDEGIGISSDVLHYLGTPFYTTKDKGIGLGLTVSNKIIQEHNGSMKIDSKYGIGTTITIELGYSC
ncbi:PAS domain-containing sensor histidine kinase [Cytobacillus purgationiresistens]|uniref:histidine kinase n=1 Tax=Cytobacillus purgationiresistens TaxID=863449 RepID=A0ABU0ASP4_9BACI|nr:PAS domain S-box protein [Cytobacillus purgationiresistens]MDQ0273453.1 two-component system sporulation sensor kinase A [Cytobacillus purgationiresistens]